jgi:hypothetical protein
MFRPALGLIQPFVQCVLGDSFLRVKLLGREADDLLLSTTEVKNSGAILHSPIHLYGVVLNQLITGTT